jgi:hypothetical protein
MGTIAREHILTRLREAARLVEADLAANLPPVRDLLDEAMDHADAWLVARMAGAKDQYADGDGDDGDRPAQSRLRVSLLAQAQGEPVGEFLLIPFGQVSVERPVSGSDFVFTDQHALSAKAWFEQIGRKLAIDYEHQSFEQFNNRADGLRPAAGWIAGLDIRDDGLWATGVSWTERARELLRNGEYRYFSPVIYWTDEDYNDIAGLGPVALTNDPAMHGVRALAARRREEVTSEKVDNLRHAPANGTIETGPLIADDVTVLREQLEANEREIARLRGHLTTREADGFIERGQRAGKILVASSADWRADYLRDADEAEARLERAPVLLPPGRVIELDTRGQVASDDRIRADLNRNAEFYRRWGIETEDLRAFEQASAAGRVKRYGT